MKKYYSVLLIFSVVAFILAFKYATNVDSHGYWLGKTRADLESLDSAVNLFILDNGRVPSDTEGLGILVNKNKEKNLPNWKKYINRLPKDYWGNEYVYSADNKTKHKYLIYSKGPDGDDAKGLDDDVVLWEKEYDCEKYNDCYTFKEYVGDIALLIGLLAFILILSGIVYQMCHYIYRKIKDNNAINSTR